MRRLLTFVCVVAGMWLAIAAASAKDEKPAPQSLAELDRALASFFSEHKIPGASVAIVENDHIVLAKGYGLADVAAKKPVTAETVFRAGSISKSIVGIAVMMLVEEGKLDLNAKLADLAPEIEFANEWEATDPVRLAHLMEHTTGFDDIRFSQYLIDGKDVPLLRAIELYGPYVSRWKPGTFPAYNNAPPVMAGYLVEKASGLSWADFTRSRIFEPLAMTSAHWDRASAIEPVLAKSYGLDGVTEEPYVDIPGKPAGSLNVTPSDLAKLAIMLNGRGTANGVALLTPESVDRIEHPQTTLAARLGLKDGYGLGNAVVAREKGVFHGHNGGIDGFLSLMLYEPTRRAGVVIMINQANGEAFKALDPVVAHFERTWPKPAPPAVAPAPDEAETLAGVYQSNAPRQQILSLLETMFDWTMVSASEGKLTIGDNAVARVGERLYQRGDRAVPGTVFAETPNGPLMLTANGASRRVPGYEIVAKAAGALFYALSLVVSAILIVVWLLAWPRGRLADRGGALVRFVPALALFAPAALLVLFIISVSDPSMSAIAALGTPSTVAQTIYVLSLSVPVLGALALFSALGARPGTPFLIRALALLNATLVLAWSAFLWQHNWIGLKTWL